MAEYAIISGGTIVNVIVANVWSDGVNITNLTPKPGIGWTYNGTTFAPPPVEPAPSAPELPSTTPYMSQFGFLIRLTAQQRLAIRDRTDKTSANYDATLDDAMFLFREAERIDVTLALTQQLVGYLAMTGLIAPADMSTLLAEIDLTSPHAKP